MTRIPLPFLTALAIVLVAAVAVLVASSGQQAHELLWVAGVGVTTVACVHGDRTA